MTVTLLWGTGKEREGCSIFLKKKKKKGGVQNLETVLVICHHIQHKPFLNIHEQLWQALMLVHRTTM